MKTVVVSPPSRSYSVQIGYDLFTKGVDGAVDKEHSGRSPASREHDFIGSMLYYTAPHQKACVISDDNVSALYLQALSDNLIAGGYKKILSYSMPAGENSKTLEQTRLIYEYLVSVRAERNTPIIALGGGGLLVIFLALLQALF